MAVEQDQVVAIVDADRDAAITLLRALIAAQREGENAVQAIVADRLAVVGSEVKRIVYAPGEVELVGEFACQADSQVSRRHGRADGEADAICTDTF